MKKEMFLLTVGLICQAACAQKKCGGPILPLPDEELRFGDHNPPFLCRSTVRRGGFPRQYLGKDRTQVSSFRNNKS
jgi:hypothetical protein